MVSAPKVNALLDLTGMAVLVTGASGNIGAGIARRLHESGALVAIHCGADRAGGDTLAAELSERTVVVQGDVAHDAERLCDEVVSAFGRIDGLVNNAGIQPVVPLLDLTGEEVDEMLRVNVTGVVAMTGSVARRIVTAGEGGAIVNIASIEGLQPAAGHSHYATSKAAVLMHTRAAALELGPSGIRVNCVAPGLVDRPGLRAAWPDGVMRWNAACPLGRLGTAEDIGDAVLMLMSRASRWITGATLVVDGGVLARSTW